MDFDYCIKDKEISFWYANGSSLPFCQEVN